MSKTTFEKLGIPYEERDGIFYPVLVAGTEKADIEAGKYGRMWIKYIKEEYPMRYKSLVRFGELEERADEVNDTAYELLDDIEAKWLKKHKPKNPNSFTEQLQLRTQTRMMAEEIVIMDVLMQFPKIISASRLSSISFLSSRYDIACPSSSKKSKSGTFQGMVKSGKSLFSAKCITFSSICVT